MISTILFDFKLRGPFVARLCTHFTVTCSGKKLNTVHKDKDIFDVVVLAAQAAAVLTSVAKSSLQRLVLELVKLT